MCLTILMVRQFWLDQHFYHSTYKYALYCNSGTFNVSRGCYYYNNKIQLIDERETIAWIEYCTYNWCNNFIPHITPTSTLSSVPINTLSACTITSSTPSTSKPNSGSNISLFTSNGKPFKDPLLYLPVVGHWLYVLNENVAVAHYGLYLNQLDS